ncbi:VWA domain-containing protein [Paeniglutamicibacter antarcticus]|uniref:VWA domain-containing protein n=1 Tax=Arthrobacter terrae TaxID=2935737 RepID=A0A931G6U2_9MICC|nr:VWA domain-containing protein [Arthrobacter terrae]MBG0738629.1 VWA domain-containing protein [Arthrobacter terrae]
MALSLKKIEETAPALLSLAKEATGALDRAGLTGHKAKVAFVLDHSGSMSRQYSSGAMQRFAEKALVLGTQFDDDGQIDFFVFDSDADYLGEISLDNYKGSVDRLRKGRHMGTTNYAAAFSSVLKHYGFVASPSAPQKRTLFGRLKGPAPVELTSLPVKEPVYVIFLTDGAPDSRTEATKGLIAAAEHPVFWKFISISPTPIPFLEKLDEMPGRKVDNANYQDVADVDKLNDDELFRVLLEEYPDWLNAARGAGLVQ